MYFFKMGIAILSLGLLFSMVTPVNAKDTLSAAQKAEVENVVRDLLLKKEPDLIIKAAEEIQRRVEKENINKGNAAIRKNKEELYNTPSDPVMGNKKGDVTIVEFFDYQCGYCKVVIPTIKELIKSDKNVRIVFKEYPILGPNSLYASRAALASIKQGKYFKFHEALMSTQQRLSENKVIAIAKKAGLDVELLQKDMADESITKTINKNRALGEEMSARGTPTFIIGDKLYPGALPVKQMKEIITTLRKAQK